MDVTLTIFKGSNLEILGKIKLYVCKINIFLTRY